MIKALKKGTPKLLNLSNKFYGHGLDPLSKMMEVMSNL